MFSAGYKESGNIFWRDMEVMEVMGVMWGTGLQRVREKTTSKDITRHRVAVKCKVIIVVNKIIMSICNAINAQKILSGKLVSGRRRGFFFSFHLVEV